MAMLNNQMIYTYIIYTHDIHCQTTSLFLNGISEYLAMRRGKNRKNRTLRAAAFHQSFVHKWKIQIHIKSELAYVATSWM